MNVLSVVLVLLFATVSYQQTIQQILKEWRKMKAPYLTRCMCQSKASAGHLEAFFQFGEVVNDPCFKCTVMCWAMADGVFTPAGNINTTAYRSLYGINDKIMRRCGNNNNADLCQKAYEVLACSFDEQSVLDRNSNTGLSVPQTKMWHYYPQLFYGKE